MHTTCNPSKSGGQPVSDRCVAHTCDLQPLHYNTVEQSSPTTYQRFEKMLSTHAVYETSTRAALRTLLLLNGRDIYFFWADANKSPQKNWFYLLRKKKNRRLSSALSNCRIVESNGWEAPHLHWLIEYAMVDWIWNGWLNTQWLIEYAMVDCYTMVGEPPLVSQTCFAPQKGTPAVVPPIVV